MSRKAAIYMHTPYQGGGGGGGDEGLYTLFMELCPQSSSIFLWNKYFFADYLCYWSWINSDIVICNDLYVQSSVIA